MAKIIAEGKTFEVDEGTNLREALLAQVWGRGRVCLDSGRGIVSIVIFQSGQFLKLRLLLSNNNKQMTCKLLPKKLTQY